MNNVTLKGNLARDPELKRLNNEKGTSFARFTIAVNRRRARNDENNNTDFISCIAFGRLAENIYKYFRKGNSILVNGHLQTGSYTNRDGQKVYTTDVLVNDFEFCDGKRNDTQNDMYAPQGTPQYDPQPAPQSAYDPAYAQAPVAPAPQTTQTPVAPAPVPAAPATDNGFAPKYSGNPFTDEDFMNIPPGIDEELPFV